MKRGKTLVGFEMPEDFEETQVEGTQVDPQPPVPPPAPPPDPQPLPTLRIEAMALQIRDYLQDGLLRPEVSDCAAELSLLKVVEILGICQVLRNNYPHDTLRRHII